MLARLITVALMASANANDVVATTKRPTPPTRANLIEHMSVKQATVTKALHSKAARISTSSISALSGDTGYVKLNLYNGACSDDAELWGIYTTEYGNCLLNYDASYSMSHVAQNENSSWNVTTKYYSTDDCSGDADSSSFMQVPGTCEDADDFLAPGVYAYVADSMSQFSTPDNTAGTISYNSEDDCENENNQMAAYSDIFGVCYPFSFFGFEFSYELDSCNELNFYPTSDCSPLDDYYYDDDFDDDFDDDYEFDDDFYDGVCVAQGGSGDEAESFDSDYWSCDNSGASLSVGRAGLFSACTLTVLAAVLGQLV